MASYPPEGFLLIIKPPVYWQPAGPNLQTLQGYVCQPLKSAIGVLVTEGDHLGEIIHLDFAAFDYLEGLRALYTRETGEDFTTEVVIQFDPAVGYSVALRTDTNAIPLRAAVERVATLKQQAAAKLEAEEAEAAKRLLEAPAPNVEAEGILSEEIPAN